MSFVAAHYIHLVLAAIWLGFLVGGLAVSRLGASKVIEYHRAYGPVALAALLLVGAVGLYMALNLGGPGDWFRFGEPSGRIGEKMISFLVLLGLGGYIHHGLVKKLESEGDRALTRYRILVGLTVLITLGTMMLGTMIAKGV